MNKTIWRDAKVEGYRVSNKLRVITKPYKRYVGKELVHVNERRVVGIIDIDDIKKVYLNNKGNWDWYVISEL
ncbi:MAG: hypothetical protein GY823_01670 [Flavobacteriaceae bacterium]|nr:hypothetical protein [Flavobacteriaceae bacterium]